MQIIKAKDDKGNPILTQEGKECYNYFLQVGDVIIPQWNSPIGREAEYVDSSDGKTKKTTYYTLKALVKDKEGNQVHRQDDGSEVIYINLTGGQAKSLLTRIEKARQEEREFYLTQNRFRATSYTDSVGGTSIGLSMVSNAPKPKSFEDFEGTTSQEDSENPQENSEDSKENEPKPTEESN